jgi:hypothetical protein
MSPSSLSQKLRLVCRAKADWRGPIKKNRGFLAKTLSAAAILFYFIFLKRGTLSADSSREGSEILRQPLATGYYALCLSIICT